MKNAVQLITYVDRLSGGDLNDLIGLLEGPLAGLFGGVHLLPFFDPIDGADAGFDPIDHTQVDPRLGSWKDLERLGSSIEIMADLIVNHASSLSAQFKDFSRNGSESLFAGMFLTYSHVFPGGATEEELIKLYRPRPGLPFSLMALENGEKRLLWTTFTSQQLDIDVLHPQGTAYLEAILERFHQARVNAIRMDAVGYAIKKRGTSCFMTDETFAFISDLSSRAHELGIEVLVEVHSYYKSQVEIAQKVDFVYDFALPPLILHALYESDVAPLVRWLSIRPHNAITVLDTHDGIGVIDVGPDSNGTPGLLEPHQIDALVENIHRFSHGQSRQATGAAASNLDLYQVNCTYLDALGNDGTLYLLARAIQFFVPGIPQVYYVGLLCGSNDMELLSRTGVGRDINRHHYTVAEVQSALLMPTVQQLLTLIRLRNTHRAFQGECTVRSNGKHHLSLDWALDQERITLDLNLEERRATITGTIGSQTDQPIMQIR